LSGWIDSGRNRAQQRFARPACIWTGTGPDGGEVISPLPTRMRRRSCRDFSFARHQFSFLPIVIEIQRKNILVREDFTELPAS
jgi:hypothetical protein